MGNILPIYKNKGDKDLPENYRPITLLSCFGKLFTAIINNRLNKYSENYEIIQPNQAGFQKGLSTSHNLFIISSLIEIVKTKKKKLYCAFIDFKQALDTVWREALWKKTKRLPYNWKMSHTYQKHVQQYKVQNLHSQWHNRLFSVHYQS